jgi:hypothetical protein
LRADAGGFAGFRTRWLPEGVHSEIVSERLGHSSVAVTLDDCGHVALAMQEAAVAALGAVLKVPSREANAGCAGYLPFVLVRRRRS